MHTSLARPPRSPDREKRSRNRRAALATRGVFFVRPKSERTSSLQFVATYFGRYSSNADDPGFTHCPDGCWPLRICAAHPFLPISRWARTTAGSSAGRSRRSRRTRRRTLGSESFARSQLRSPRRRAMLHPGTGGPYLSPPRGDRLRRARCDRVIWAEPFQRASRLSSAWSERVTVECSRAPSCAVPAAIIRPPVQIREAGLSFVNEERVGRLVRARAAYVRGAASYAPVWSAASVTATACAFGGAVVHPSASLRYKNTGSPRRAMTVPFWGRLYPAESRASNGSPRPTSPPGSSNPSP